ncbi:MAG: heterodisulfide reductase-related iron-sulfur binding cluster [Candidatus Methanomethylicia archaeon]|nr:heterodisulfide reductase-related iron-sulfur binding cluster [Candidatus Methanomethylicia archaeon]
MYYPGCSVKDYAKRYEETALCILKILGIELIELNRWNCCGVVYEYSADALIQHIAPLRNLIRAQEFMESIGDNRLITLCSMCYNTLKKINEIVINDSEKLDTLSKYMDDEPKYNCGIEVKHILELIIDDNIIGFNKIKGMIKRNLSKLKVASFYGCALLRPKGIGIDDHEDPYILHNLINSLGAKPVKFPYEKKCCGSYNIVYDRGIVEKIVSEIVYAAVRWGANLIITPCSLCHYNLNLVRNKFNMPTIYFTELMAYAIGLDDKIPEETLLILEGKINGGG